MHIILGAYTILLITRRYDVLVETAHRNSLPSNMIAIHNNIITIVVIVIITI